MCEPMYGDEKIDPSILKGADLLVGSSYSLKIEERPLEIMNKEFEKALPEGVKAFFNKYDDIGLIVNDRNRPTPTWLVLGYLRSEHPSVLGRIGTVHIATGTHKAPSEDEIRTILGPCFSELRGKVHVHDARDENSHDTIGTTSLGTVVRVDKAIKDHDLLMFINSVEPHYFAGYTGGRKSILPGMSAYSTVEKNHSHALSAGSRTLGLDDNPVHTDMEEAVGMYLEGRKHISVQLVQGIGRELTSAHVGDVFSAFREGVKAANDQFCIPIRKRYDIVMSIARPPMDRTLYQAQKAIENGKLALKKDGVMILVAKCSEGIGQSAFWDLITMSADRKETLRRISEKYVLGYHKAAKLVQLSETAEIYAVTEIPKEELERGFIKGMDDVGSAVEAARDRMGKDAAMLVIPDGTMTVPLFE